LIIQRLGHFSGALETLAHLHAAIFVALVIVTSARAFFVVSEMDLGRYAGEEEVPSILGKSMVHKIGETIARALIILLLTGFAYSFFKVVIPASGSDFPSIGEPAIVSNLSKECAEYKRFVERGGFDQPKSECIRSRLTELTEGEIRVLAVDLIRPIEALLLPTYIIMMLWCSVVWRGVRAAVSDKVRLRRALLLQVSIAALALLSGVIMVCWIELAAYGRIPVLQIASSDEFQRGALTILSGCGITVAVICFCVLALRLNSDRAMLYALAVRRHRAHSGEDISTDVHRTA
jgi:hypothetical protein